MALNDARLVTLADTSFYAVSNAIKNIVKYRITNAIAEQSDLFQFIASRFDLIVFNHPFFAEHEVGIYPDQPISKSMVAPPTLIHRFLKEAKDHLELGGKIIMPFLELAGEINNPKIQGPAHGYKVKEVYSANVESGVQTGLFYIYCLEI
jgi:methylase of polypeptide subunit release factors